MPLLAAPAALLLNPGRADAILTYNIFEDGGNVVVQTSGSLVLPSPTINFASCGNGTLRSDFAVICSGPNASFRFYSLVSPDSFNGSVNATTATLSGITTAFAGRFGVFLIDDAYVSGTEIVSGSTYNGTTLADLGFTISSGLIGTWQLAGTPGPDGQINMVLGPPATPVPGPLPLLGAAAAFGWSRKLRRRVNAACTTSII